MTTGNIAYLIMVVVVFAVFSAVLAYVSWLQSKAGPDMLAEPEQSHRHDEPHDAIPV